MFERRTLKRPTLNFQFSTYSGALDGPARTPQVLADGHLYLGRVDAKTRLASGSNRKVSSETGHFCGLPAVFVLHLL